MQRWLSWSKAHDWKSCVRLITDRGFESHPLRRKSHESKDSWDFLCVDLQSAYQTAFADQTAYADQTAFGELSAAGTRMPWHPVPFRAACTYLRTGALTCSRLISFAYIRKRRWAYIVCIGFTRDEYHVIRVDFIVALRRTKGRRRRTLRSPSPPWNHACVVHWTPPPHPGESAAAGHFGCRG